MNGGVESGLFRVSGSRWRIAADVHGDKNRESPREARQQTDRCGWRRQLAPLRMLLVPQTLCFQGCWLSVAANTMFLSSGVQGPVTVMKTATNLRYCNRKWIFFSYQLGLHSPAYLVRNDTLTRLDFYLLASGCDQQV